MSDTDYLHSGSSASKETAAHRADRMIEVHHWVRIAGPSGMTWREIAKRSGLHHGAVSGALSRLHQVGKIARLTERRERCHVYVDVPMLGGRAAEPHGGKKAERDLAIKIVERVREAHQPRWAPDAWGLMTQVCQCDRHAWPCRTARIINREEGVR